ncbi:MAG TPA: PIG-L family deacetylase [bacterium]|nr:PIG-L family deacetylase [bacterium]
MNGGTRLGRLAASLLAIVLSVPALPAARALAHAPANVAAAASAGGPAWPGARGGLGRGASVVVFAAHPDDETLGAGGLIHAAVAAGAHVTVVVLTNGDGYLGGVDVRFRTLISTPRRFIQYGRTRQQEALAAAAQLGVPASDVLFLGYPDRGLAALWGSHWDCRHPYTSPYTRRSRGPYALAYRPGAVYCGEGLLAGITAILNHAKPALVVVHHPADTHPDHWAAAAFVTLALEQAALAGDGWQRRVRTYHYLVHDGAGWPMPRGYAPEQPLTPPAGLAVRPHWVAAPLGPDDEDAKRRALGAYRSQLALSRAYLFSFVRRNELYDLCPSVSVTPLSGAAPPLARPERWDGLPALLGPGRGGSLLGAAQGGAVLDGIAVARTSDRLLIAVRLRRPAQREVGYRVELRLFNRDGRAARLDMWFGVPGSLRAERRGPADLPVPEGGAARSFGRRIHISLPLAALGTPVAVYMRVVTFGAFHTAVDRTPWTLVRLGRPAADGAVGPARF